MEQKRFKKPRKQTAFSSASPVFQISIEDISPNRSQPRRDFDNDSIIRLADSIKRYGIIQPLVIRRAELEDPRPYELIAGERRLRAARSLGLFSVPCVICQTDEKTSAEMAIIENLLRKDLNMFEQAKSFKKLIDNFNMTQEEVAKQLSMSQSAIANKIRLLKLTENEQKMICERSLTERHARALLKLDDPTLREEAIRYISATSLNVANSELYIDMLAQRAEKEAKLQSSGENSALLPDSKSAEEFAAQAESKAATVFIDAVKRKIDALNRHGKNASIDISTTKKSIELHISIAK